MEIAGFGSLILEVTSSQWGAGQGVVVQGVSGI
jgi:hypothetical protein